MTRPPQPRGAPAAGTPPRVDGELAAWVESGLFVVVGTRDGSLTPEITRGWGPRLLPGGNSYEVWLGSVVGRRALANLRENGAIATNLTQATTYRSVQLVGRCLEIGEPQDADAPTVARHRQALTAVAPAIGLLPLATRNLLPWDPLVPVRVSIEQLFDQTPGPHAGRRL